MNQTAEKIIETIPVTGGVDFKRIASELVGSIDFHDCYFQKSLLFIVFNPVFWNIVARLEYSTHFLTKLAGGNAKRGCYLLAIIIFTLGIGRDLMFEKALRLQPSLPLFQNLYVKMLGYVFTAIGQVFVLTSMYQLGVTGTYLGDYFGILMDHRVTSFPFNVSNNPMYQGSTLTFLGYTLLFAKPAGLIVTAMVHLMYKIALRFEEPFTAKIYAQKQLDERRKHK
ncbi:hypothetical protein KAFR_0K02560 [Kazachstania africana CBS 2517]|uniref:Phosphatidyl-N-methylethanolamine N-methyltransferase n=1 Tax=Kazachstania africana (strain ATCC 22294 / BCRC 22015 / CBS 2517 / CECT 1963 / NBRC 1671 / NRRL Y-8276) TaxID=1071382 RepID=H2B1W2_KAZAF|nr:hypothetical protein KAFR_0K02560 [Kazachstania africana CBS 2517]CCF60612.1 hypothetical protein KAFR_0K02560 [Kazachstania africana CBS 2517]